MENNNSRDKKSQDTQKDKNFDYYDDVKTNIKEDW